MASWLDKLTQDIRYGLGNAIDTIGTSFNANAPQTLYGGKTDFSKLLMNQAYASDIPSSYNKTVTTPSYHNIATTDKSAGGGDGGGGNPNPNPSNPDTGNEGGDGGVLDYLRKQQEIAMNQIRERLNRGRQEASDLVGRTRKYVDEELNPTITRTFEDLTGNARQRAGDVETQNRIYSRAKGNLGSSAYDQAQYKNRENLQNEAADLDVQQATDMRSSEALMKDALDQAAKIESANTDQFNYDVGAADNYVTSYLSNMMQKNDALKELGASVPGQSNSALQSILSNIFAAPSANLGKTTTTTGNPVSSTTLEDILKSRSGLYGYAL